MEILELATQGPPGPPGPAGLSAAGASGVVTAKDFWGQSLALTAGATGTLASLTSASAYQVKGMVAHGTGDGYFFIQVASMTVLSGRIRATAPVLTVVLEDGINVVAGALVTFQVTNESGSTADFEATLLGA